MRHSPILAAQAECCMLAPARGRTGLQMNLASGAGSIEGHDSSVGGVHTAAKLAVAGLHN